VAGDMRYTIADVPGLIPGASQGKGLGLEFLRHIERTEIIAHVIDCATLEPGRDPMSDYQALEHELAEYAGKLELPLGAIPIPERPRIIILNKVDVPEAKELAEFVKPEFEKLGLKVYIISTASHEGLKELNWALADLVTNMRAEVAKREQAEEEARVVIKPLEEPRNRRRRNDEGGNALDFTVERKENGNGEVWYEVLGTKPERWVMQTNFDNDEAVGYLADRLAKLGVEDELRHKGAKPGDEVITFAPYFPEYQPYVNGTGAHSEFTGVTFAGHSQNLDTGCKVVHNAPKTTSIVNTRSISKSGGISTFRSSVVVTNKAKQAKSSVSCQSLMLDNISRSDTIPAIDVRTADADIGHEAKIGRISDDAVFYLMSRGISEEEARAMIVSGFADNVSKELPLEYAVEMNNLIRLEMQGSIG